MMDAEGGDGCGGGGGGADIRILRLSLSSFYHRIEWNRTKGDSHNDEERSLIIMLIIMN
jgi:hypothetical protein